MTVDGASPARRNFLGIRFKSKSNSPKQHFTHPDLAFNYADISPHIPKQAHNPAIHPLLAKPTAREENFVLLPHGDFPMERKRELNSPIRSPVEPKAQHTGPSEWDQYLTSYTEVSSTFL
jgi:hypothetical protein